MAKTRSEYYTRTRFLNQLGLFQEPLPKISAATTPSHATTNRAGVDGSCSSYTECQHASSHGSMVPFEIKLNDSSWQDEQSMGRSSCHSSIDTDSMESSFIQQKQHHIHFKDTVCVIPIPSRYQYSDRIKQRIWSNRIELREMAQRNMLEFESEGFDWRNVVLEDDMYIDACNGNYVHPCHVRTSRQYPQISSMRIATLDGGGGTRSLQEVLGNNEEDEDDDEEEDENYHFAPLQRLDSIVMA